MDVFADEMESLLFPVESQDAAWPPAANSAEALQVMVLLDQIREKLGLRRDY